MQGDSELLWSLEPNRRFQTGNDVTEINEIGLRENSCHPNRKSNENGYLSLVTPVSTDGVYRIIKPMRFSWKRKRLFKVPIEVINLGVPGYSTEQTLKLLEKVGWDYQPDLIVVSNIFSDCNIDAFQDEKQWHSPIQNKISYTALSVLLDCIVPCICLGQNFRQISTKVPIEF